MDGQRDERAAASGSEVDQSTDWISRFAAVTSSISTPELFRRWAGIYTVASALQRNVWVVTDGDKLYANLYVIIVAPPGVGKGKIIKKARELLTPLDEHFLGRSSLTSASIVDELAEATRRWTRPNENPIVVSFNSLSIVSSELGVLIPDYDPSFMNKLQDLYDCVFFSERRRTRDINIELPAPQLGIFAACTPAYLQSTLPESAWAEGFTSRTIFVYSGDQVIDSLFKETRDDTAKMKELGAELKEINQLYGKMGFTLEARNFLDGWHMSGREPVPDHPKLLNYNTRRTAHLIKLSMIAAISETKKLLIELHHVQRALEWLIEAEHYIPEIFKSMANTSHSQILKDTWHYVFDTWRKENKKPVVEKRILNFISQRVPAHNVVNVLKILESSGYLRRQLGSNGNEYIPSKPGEQ